MPQHICNSQNHQPINSHQFWEGQKWNFSSNNLPTFRSHLKTIISAVIVTMELAVCTFFSGMCSPLFLSAILNENSFALFFLFFHARKTSGDKLFALFPTSGPNQLCVCCSTTSFFVNVCGQNIYDPAGLPHRKTQRMPFLGSNAAFYHPRAVDKRKSCYIASENVLIVGKSRRWKSLTGETSKTKWLSSQHGAPNTNHHNRNHQMWVAGKDYLST